MGDYFLWGYYNDHPVYQHYSGLDFLYFHTNQVRGNILQKKKVFMDRNTGTGKENSLF